MKPGRRMDAAVAASDGYEVIKKGKEYCFSDGTPVPKYSTDLNATYEYIKQLEKLNTGVRIGSYRSNGGFLVFECVLTQLNHNQVFLGKGLHTTLPGAVALAILHARSSQVFEAFLMLDELGLADE